jgi:hypothetical protein
MKIGEFISNEADWTYACTDGTVISGPHFISKERK